MGKRRRPTQMRKSLVREKKKANGKAENEARGGGNRKDRRNSIASAEKRSLEKNPEKRTGVEGDWIRGPKLKREMSLRWIIGTRN